jgi:uroporphyrinogen decarboxylase
LDLIAKNHTLAHILLATLAKAVAEHLKAQIRAGVDVVMIFDTWGGLLGKEQYETFSLNYIQTICAEIKKDHTYTPVILFAKGASQYLDKISAINCDVLSVDEHITLNEVKKCIKDIALQGNMRPDFLLKTPDKIRQEVTRILETFGPGSGHIFNLSHGITPDVPPENVAVLVEAVHELSKCYHQA